MRKVKPQDVISRFDSFVSDRQAYFTRVELLVKGTATEKRDMSILAETTLQATYVAFETFISDLLIAYINRNFFIYQSNLELRVKASIESKFNSWTKDRVTFNKLQHIGIDALETLLDPTGWNMTFKNVAQMKLRFADWVDPVLGANVAAINVHDAALIDAAHAMRNYISHRSPSSKTVMNSKLSVITTAAVGGPNIGLLIGANDRHDVGSYLKTSVGGKRRVEIYMERLKAIAAVL